jgi:hypothetical protein
LIFSYRLKREKRTGRRMRRGNHELNPDPSGVRLMLRPRKLEKVVRVSSPTGGARRVVKLNVSGILLLVKKSGELR